MNFGSAWRGLTSIFSFKGQKFMSLSWNIFNTKPQFNTYIDDDAKLKVVLASPALLKVICLQCDLFSLGKIYAKKNNEERDDDPIIDMLNSPNPFQSRPQWLWDYMFWKMIGNSYCYVDSTIVSNTNKLYFLQPGRIEFPPGFNMTTDKLILSNASLDAINKTPIKYRYYDGTYFATQLGNIICTADLTNGIGNWHKGPSRLDALYKIISNSEAALDSKNINVRFSSKWTISGTTDPSNTTQFPLSPEEQESAEQSAFGTKEIHAIKSKVNVDRFVSDIAALKLDDSYLADYFLIGSMFSIPRDVLEAGTSSTYENQEKARGAHITYCLQPAADLFMAELKRKFNYKYDLVMDWNHLPHMQVFAREEAQMLMFKSQALINLQTAGATLDDINQFLATTFTKLTPKKPTPPKPAGPNDNSQQQPGQEANQSGSGEGDQTAS